MMRLLIAHDGSPFADAALQDLATAGIPGSPQVLVLSVADVWLPPDDAFAGPSVTEAVLREVRDDARVVFRNARHIARAAARTLHERFPAWRVHALATAGPPAVQIMKRADHVRADLVITGAHGRSRLIPPMLGSVAFKVLTHLQRSVRIGRASPEPRDPRQPLRLLVGVDGSPHCQAALREVCSRAWPTGTVVHIITAIEPHASSAALHGAMSQGRTPSESAFCVAREAVQLLRRHHLDVSEIVERGDPRELLLTDAEEWRADAIFVGARGLTRTQQLFLGNVPTYLAMRARCSVEVVHLREPTITNAPADTARNASQ
jgi:nucleotide-binding universal stress UspA family protein